MTAVGDPAQAYATLAEAVGAAQAAGHSAGLALHLAAQTLWAAIHGVMSLELSKMPEEREGKHIPAVPLEERIEVALGAVIAGLEAVAARRGGAASAKPGAGRTSKKKR